MAKKPNSGSKTTDIVNSCVVESYKSLRANLNFAITKKGCKIVMFSGPEKSEGKTTTCLNLAITIAQSGSKIIVLDCDLRRPRIHRMLGMEDHMGMSNLLSNMCELDDVVLETSTPNLSSILSGKIPPNPGELLASQRFEEILNELSEQYEYIFIDTSPVNMVSDALPISKFCNGVVIVVMCYKSTHPSLNEAISKLNFAKANIIGIVLNGVKIKQIGKYSYSKHYEEYKNVNV